MAAVVTETVEAEIATSTIATEEKTDPGNEKKEASEKKIIIAVCCDYSPPRIEGPYRFGCEGEVSQSDLCYCQECGGRFCFTHACAARRCWNHMCRKSWYCRKCTIHHYQVKKMKESPVCRFCRGPIR